MEVLIAGAGVIGLSLALELHGRGARVTVLESGKAVNEASIAAAGMLAVRDPANPIELKPLAELAERLYPAYLDKIEELGGHRVAFQTTTTLQGVGAAIQAVEDVSAILPQLTAGPQRFCLLDERSVDPRELGAALMAAVRAAGVTVCEGESLVRMRAEANSMRVETSAGRTLEAGYVVDCMGAWTPAPVAPVKGQILSVVLPESLPLEMVVRTEDVYVVPRTQGPRAGTAVIGATVEFAGFDKAVQPKAMLALHEKACALFPQMREAKFHDSWAGLRPGTQDGLPLLGPSPRQPRYVLANGHYRNGILLAPASARVIAEIISGEKTSVDLAAFSVGRL